MLIQRAPESHWKGKGKIKTDDGKTVWVAYYDIELERPDRANIGLVKTKSSPRAWVSGGVVTEPALYDTPGDLTLYLESGRPVLLSRVELDTELFPDLVRYLVDGYFLDTEPAQS